MTAPKTVVEPHAEKDEMLHLAAALEGLVGAMQAGHPVPRADLDQAAAAAKQLLDEVGQDPSSEFPAHRRILLEHAAGAARGEMSDVSLARRAARRMAEYLRARAQDLAGPVRRVPPELGIVVHHLDSRYARFAPKVAGAAS